MSSASAVQSTNTELRAALLQRTNFGQLALKNRLVMAPLTRLRADVRGVPRKLIAEYYQQRAEAGLIITEGTFPSIESKALDGQPGIITQEQVEGWKTVTDVVHRSGTPIVLQLMHSGRVSHTNVTGTDAIYAPSAIGMPGTIRTAKGQLPYPTPSPLSLAGIDKVIGDFVQAATNAVLAGFDAVEIHGANGYLLHQFLAPNTNTREDEYGGTPSKRARLLLEVTTAVAEAIGADRVGVRISPTNNIHGIEEVDSSDLHQTYQAVASGLSTLELAYLHIVHPDPGSDFIQTLRQLAKTPIIANNGPASPTTRQDVMRLLTEDQAEAVSVGRAILANPDLLQRWTDGHPENTPDPDTFYGSTERGFTDYPRFQLH